MAFKARLVHGDPLMIDHTPSSNVAAGDIVVLENRPHVAHKDIAANKLGALAAFGGVYEVVKDGTDGPVFTAGEEAYWDVGAQEASDDDSDGAHFGYAAKAAGTNVASVLLVHLPNGTDDSSS